MTQVARLYINGRLQVIRAPSASPGTSEEPLMRQDEETGELILAPRPPSWTKFYASLKRATAPAENKRTKA